MNTSQETILDLRRLLTLRTILEEGSFAKAASKLCCTQSTVTFQIRQLEAEYGVQLFEKLVAAWCQRMPPEYDAPYS